MKDDDIIIINNNEYKYNSYCKSFMATNDKVFPAVICGICKKDKFQIAYGNYECIAKCECGHIMTIYEG